MLIISRTRLQGAAVLLTIFLALSFSTAIHAGEQQSPRGATGSSVDLDRRAMIEIEDLTESLANFLLEFSASVRSLQASRLVPYFSEKTVLRLPRIESIDDLEKVQWIWFGHQELKKDPPADADHAVLETEWKNLLAHFSEIEDARFKIKDSHFSRTGSSATGDCKIKYFLVGRNTEGNRVWVKGTGHLKASGGIEEGWRISLMELDEADYYRSETDLFSEISEPAGVKVSLPSFGSKGNDNFVYHGAAASDLDDDGYVDIIATGIADTYIYLNSGDGTFENVSWDVGIPPDSSLTAPLPLDFDNDGDQDLFFSSTGSQKLFENRLVPEGELGFKDISLESGVSIPAHGFSAVAGDINGDGYPDIYVTGYNHYGIVMPNSWHQATNGTRNLLFINNGNGTFQESSEEWGVSDTRWSYAAQFTDLNRDGRQDLYVANDFGENALYLNLGNRFEDRAESLGTVDPGNGMGVSISDYNNDGNFDLLVTNMSSTAGNRILNRLYPDTRPGDHILRKISAGSNLYRGNDDGTFTDVTQEAGPFSLGWSWGGLFIDFDNDGWEDIYISSGFVSGDSMKDT